MKHIPALDGLRAVAITLVQAVHGLRPQFPGAFIGVDVFFVLSGYLITASLLDEHDRTGRINIWYFYVRRALRLMPALWIMVPVILLLAAHWIPRIISRKISGMPLGRSATRPIGFGWPRTDTGTCSIIPGHWR